MLSYETHETTLHETHETALPRPLGALEKLFWFINQNTFRHRRRGRRLHACQAVARCPRSSLPTVGADLDPPWSEWCKIQYRRFRRHNRRRNFLHRASAPALTPMGEYQRE